MLGVLELRPGPRVAAAATQIECTGLDTIRHDRVARGVQERSRHQW